MDNADLLGAGGTLRATLEAIQSSNRQVSILLVVPGMSCAGWVFRVGEGWVVIRQDHDNKSDARDVMILFTAIAYLDVALRPQTMRNAI
jgi:hypothetical protein